MSFLFIRELKAPSEKSKYNEEIKESLKTTPFLEKTNESYLEERTFKIERFGVFYS